jgi:NhaP-type Na+/H+ and K+/H+ antiporter
MGYMERLVLAVYVVGFVIGQQDIEPKYLINVMHRFLTLNLKTIINLVWYTSGGWLL